MEEEIKIFQLQYLINETGIIGDYEIKHIKNKNFTRGSSWKTIWKTNAEGNIIEYDSDIVWNDVGPPATSKVLKFRYRTEYQVHHQLIDLKNEQTEKLVWNLSELLFRHKCMIQQLFIEKSEFVNNKFAETTESFYHSYQEVKQILGS